MMRFVLGVLKMYPLPYTWPIALCFWTAFVWTAAGELPIARRSRQQPVAKTDRGSRVLVEAMTVASAAGAFYAAAVYEFFAITFLRVPIYFCGVACLVAAGFLRRHCFAMLGDSFTFDVRVVPGQQVVERGAYRSIRHPSYTAGLLAMFGIGLALDNWLSLALSVVPMAIGYAYRISVEERALVSALGPVYSDYMKRTRRLIPFVL